MELGGLVILTFSPIDDHVCEVSNGILSEIVSTKDFILDLRI